jgi:Tol biopolymer transport system component
MQLSPRLMTPYWFRFCLGILLISFALMLAANGVARWFPSLPVIYAHQSKVEILDLIRGIQQPIGGDYQVPASFLHITPVTSPDRQWIAVQNGSNGVWVLNLAERTHNLQALPFAQPIWSPDSRYVATIPLQIEETMNIQSNAQWMDIHVADVRSGETRLITPSHQFVRIWALGWSADSDRMVFVAQKSPLPEYNFYTVRRDGSDLKALDCMLDQYAQNFVFAPGGQRAAFTVKTGETFHIFVLNLADCSRTQISDGAVFDDLTMWSPDGMRIVFLSGRDGQPDLYRMDADGGEVTRLTNTLDNETPLSWSPDGYYLLYFSFPQAGGGITFWYADLRDGSLHRFDLHHGQTQSFPAWGF